MDYNQRSACAFAISFLGFSVLKLMNQMSVEYKYNLTFVLRFGFVGNSWWCDDFVLFFISSAFLICWLDGRPRSCWTGIQSTRRLQIHEQFSSLTLHERLVSHSLFRRHILKTIQQKPLLQTFVQIMYQLIWDLSVPSSCCSIFSAVFDYEILMQRHKTGFDVDEVLGSTCWSCYLHIYGR